MNLTRRWMVACSTALAWAMAVPEMTEAHVTLQPAEAAAKAFVVEDVRVPNEDPAANVTKVSVKFPDGFAEVSYEPVPGWSVKVKKTKLATPITTDEGNK